MFGLSYDFKTRNKDFDSGGGVGEVNIFIVIISLLNTKIMYCLCVAWNW